MRKQPIVFIMAGLVCALTIGAGCTGTPTTRTTPAGAMTPAPPGAAPTARTGTRTRVEDDEPLSPLMNHHETGSSVSETFENSDAAIPGTGAGSTLIGTWAEFNGTEESTGSYEFALSPDLDSFAGRWAFAPQALARPTYA